MTLLRSSSCLPSSFAAMTGSFSFSSARLLFTATSSPSPLLSRSAMIRFSPLTSTVATSAAPTSSPLLSTLSSHRSLLHTSNNPPAMNAPNAQGGSNNKWRILNTVLPDKKPVAYALTNIYGVGLAQALRACGDLGLNPTAKLNTLEHCFPTLRAYIEARFPAKHIAQKELGATILAKVKLGTYQGVRHTLCLPVHGQRTHTNAKTQRRLGRARAMLFNIPLKKKGAAQGTNRTPPKRPA